MGLANVLPQREVQTLSSARLQKTKPFPLVAAGLQKESQIDLYVLVYAGVRQASVFVYASWFDLRPEKILELDSHISDVSSRIVRREFKGTSVEELDRAFLACAKPLLSTMDHAYMLHKPPLLEHSFSDQARRYLVGVIQDLKVK